MYVNLTEAIYDACCKDKQMIQSPGSVGWYAGCSRQSWNRTIPGEELLVSLEKELWKLDLPEKQYALYANALCQWSHKTHGTKPSLSSVYFNHPQEC